MKKMKKTFGAIALSLGLLSTTIAAGTANAATYDTASIKDFRTVHTQTSVYSKPSQTAKKVGSLRSTEAVVINKNVANGWTKIRFGFETGYVKTSALKKAATNTSTSYAKNISKNIRMRCHKTKALNSQHNMLHNLKRQWRITTHLLTSGSIILSQMHKV